MSCLFILFTINKSLFDQISDELVHSVCPGPHVPVCTDSVPLSFRLDTKSCQQDAFIQYFEPMTCSPTAYSLIQENAAKSVTFKCFTWTGLNEKYESVYGIEQV